MLLLADIDCETWLELAGMVLISSFFLFNKTEYRTKFASYSNSRFAAMPLVLATGLLLRAHADYCPDADYEKIHTSGLVRSTATYDSREGKQSTLHTIICMNECDESSASLDLTAKAARVLEGKYADEPLQLVYLAKDSLQPPKNASSPSSLHPVVEIRASSDGSLLYKRDVLRHWSRVVLKVFAALIGLLTSVYIRFFRKPSERRN